VSPGYDKIAVYHCFDRIVIYGYLSGLSRPEQVVHFFRQVVGVPVVSKEALSRRTADYQTWVEAFAHNHRDRRGREGGWARRTMSCRGNAAWHSRRSRSGRRPEQRNP
jgi:hypothetical protein